MARTAGHGKGTKRATNRSEMVRRALQEFISRRRKHEREEGDRKVLAANRERLARQANALVAEQAEL